MLNFDLGAFHSFTSIDIGVTGLEPASGNRAELRRAELLKVDVGMDALEGLVSGAAAAEFRCGISLKLDVGMDLSTGLASCPALDVRSGAELNVDVGMDAILK